MGSLQIILVQISKPGAEEKDLSKYDSFNVDVRDDIIEYDTERHQQIACKHDGVGEEIIGRKSYHQG